MMRDCTGMTIIECENLGRPALLVHTTDKPLLLLDADLTHEDRCDIMSQLLGDPDAA